MHRGPCSRQGVPLLVIGSASLDTSMHSNGQAGVFDVRLQKSLVFRDCKRAVLFFFFFFVFSFFDFSFCCFLFGNVVVCSWEGVIWTINLSSSSMHALLLHFFG